ncbi:mucin-5AC [Labeo rohita]|uniref:mucin-5AC n=1 Tax=Labeo rohita TaxID=84645 RepID=UPI0021E1D894|nr:mucin-5AC [Labeo rohita]
MSGKPVTVVHTSEISTTAKRVTQEPTTHADTSSSTTGITTLRAPGTTESTFAPTTAGPTTEASSPLPETDEVKTTIAKSFKTTESSAEAPTLLVPISATIAPSAGETPALPATAAGTNTAATVRNVPESTKKAGVSSTVLHSMAVDTVTTTSSTSLVESATAPKASTLTSALPANASGSTTSTAVRNEPESTKTTLAEGSSTVLYSEYNTTLKTTLTSMKTVTVTHNSTTVAPTTEDTNTDPPTLEEGSIHLGFSLNETFRDVYNNQSSPEFIELASHVVTVINRIYRASNLKGYKRCRVNGFSKGSIKVDMTLIFENTSTVPTSFVVETILNGTAVNSSISLDIILDTIKAGEVVTSSTAAPVTTAESATLRYTSSTNENTNTTSGAFPWIVRCSLLTLSPAITILLAQTMTFL